MYYHSTAARACQSNAPWGELKYPVYMLPESRAINPATSKTMKDLKLEVVTCVSSKIMPFLFHVAMMVLKLHSTQNISLFIPVYPANSTRQ